MYRSVLLNNGRRVRPNSVPDLAGDSQPFGERISNEEEEKEASDLEALLYRADIPVGSRGDIIQFYNKVFIGYIKDFVTRFSPVEDVSCMDASWYAGDYLCFFSRDGLHSCLLFLSLGDQQCLLANYPRTTKFLSHH